MQPDTMLQLAVDVLSLDEAMRVIESVYPNFDIVEVGTPLIYEEGLRAVETIRARFPDRLCLADLKIMDAGHIESSSGFRRGADLVTVLAAADDRTILDALEAAAEAEGREVMVDLINAPRPADRARELVELGVSLFCVHMAYDAQGGDQDPLESFQQVRQAVSCRLAVAGGLDAESSRKASAMGADIVVVGGGILGHPDPRGAAAEVMRAIKGEEP